MNPALLAYLTLAPCIWEHLEQLSKANIHFLVISLERSPTAKQDSMKHDARGVLLKPLGVKDLVERIEPKKSRLRSNR